MLVENLQTLNSIDSVKWVSLTIAFLLLGAWFFVQNKHFDYRSGSPSRSDYITLLRAARIRSTVINILLWTFFAGFFAYEFMESQPGSGSNPVARAAVEPVVEQLAPEVSPIRVERIPAADTAVGEASFLSENPETALDALKERYEDVFVSYLYLKRCEKAGDADYPVIVQAFQDEVKNMQYDPSLFQSVYDAAEGSYSAIYRDSKCDDATLLPVLERFKTWLDGATEEPVANLEVKETTDVATN